MIRRSARFGAALAALCLTGSLLGSASLGGTSLRRAGRDLPPPAHTGGFDEPLCTTCHIQADVNAGTGTITIAGLPHEYEPAVMYALTITIAQEYLTAGGFQMSARFPDGTQAGSLAPGPADEARIGVTTHGGVQYIHHVYAGTQAVSPDTARWQVVWTAPAAERATGAVVFHVAGNAADDDESPLGDMIYATSVHTVSGN